MAQSKPMFHKKGPEYRSLRDATGDGFDPTLPIVIVEHHPLLQVVLHDPPEVWRQAMIPHGLPDHGKGKGSEGVCNIK